MVDVEFHNGKDANQILTQMINIERKQKCIFWTAYDINEICTHKHTHKN